MSKGGNIPVMHGGLPWESSMSQMFLKEKLYCDTKFLLQFSLIVNI